MKMKKKEEKEEASLKAKFKEAKEQTTISLKCNDGKEKNEEEVNDQPAMYAIELEDKEKLLSLIRGLSVEAIMSKIPLEEETPVQD